MAFSKGKRIEDETSTRIVDLAVNIGCREGYDALTVTRLCKELNCDRRVVYNRFRDVDEINLIVAGRCNDEVIVEAKKVINEADAYCDRFTSFVKAVFSYIYERNSYFQYYTALYQVSECGIENGILQELDSILTAGKETNAIKQDTDCKLAALDIWTMLVGFSSMLANHVNYSYQDALNSFLFGVSAIYRSIEK